MKSSTDIYRTKINKLSGSNFKEVEKQAKKIFRSIKTKRTPYLRSKYFRGEKVFLNIFWRHLYDKHEKDRTRRLKFYECAFDLISNNSNNPTTKDNPNKPEEILYRFLGVTKSNEYFRVQIKENKRTKRKDLISIIPDK
ncbi:MAG: hypothetical protein ACD_58C00322G0008 [uncultured bacterium]|nr:MAG: hypothetical protein ACD_58C00322G0008 [uncultured bacterium]